VSNILIDSSFFVGDIVIPNTERPAISERIDWFISKYEKECLVKLLGVKLFNAFINDSKYNILPLDSDTPTRMQNLTFGSDFTTPDGSLFNWSGILQNTNTSLVANYVYCEWERANASQSTGIATATMNTNAGNSISPAEKIVNAGLYITRQARMCAAFLWNNRDVYTEYTINDYKNTISEFMYVNIFDI